LTGHRYSRNIKHKKKNGQRALLLEEAPEKLLTAILPSKKSVPASSATVKFQLAWSLEVFYGCHSFPEWPQKY
jgi:hypothetical protein